MVMFMVKMKVMSAVVDMVTVKKADAVVVAMVMVMITVKKVDVVVAVMEKVVTATVMAVVVANINLVKPLKKERDNAPFLFLPTVLLELNNEVEGSHLQGERALTIGMTLIVR